MGEETNLSRSTIPNNIYLKYKLYSAIKKMEPNSSELTFGLCIVTPSKNVGENRLVEHEELTVEKPDKHYTE